MSDLGLIPPRDVPVKVLPHKTSAGLKLMGEPCFSTPRMTVFPHPCIPNKILSSKIKKRVHDRTTVLRHGICPRIVEV